MKPVSLIIALLLLATAYNSVYTVEQGRIGAVSQFGQSVRLEASPGLHFKWPWLQQVASIDQRLQSSQLTVAGQQTADAQTVDLGLSLSWQVTDAQRYSAKHGSTQAVLAELQQWADDHLRKIVAGQSLPHLSGISSDTLFAAALPALRQQLQTRLGVQLDDLQLRQLSVPDQDLPALYHQMQASQSRLAEQLRVQGQAAAEKIQADAEQAAHQQVADARIQASRLRGEGEAKALQISAEAAAQDPDFFAFYQNLQAYRAAFEQGGNVWILRPDSSFLKTLDSGANPATTIHRSAR